MYDLHGPVLTTIDDQAADVDTALAMASAYVEQGVRHLVCAPNRSMGPQSLAAVAPMQKRLNDAGVPLRLFSEADNQMVPDFAAGLKAGHLLTLAGSPFVPGEIPDLERDGTTRGSRRDDGFAPASAAGGGSGFARRMRNLPGR